MENGIITIEKVEQFSDWLISEERSAGTVQKYRRDVIHLMNWLHGRALSREALVEWRESLLSAGYAPVSINSMLAAINRYCAFMGLNIHVKFLRIQHRLFRDEQRELTQSEYARLIHTAAEKKQHRLALMIETIGASGIRVSEMKYITVEAATKGKAQINLKGKIRTILLPGKLCHKLLKYARKQQIASGEIFLTKGGKSISRTQIWAEMKALCKTADVLPSKVFPHNLRHLFARIYYKASRDIVQLADVLGHSSIETTRIYLIGTGKEYIRNLNALGLVV